MNKLRSHHFSDQIVCLWECSGLSQASFQLGMWNTDYHHCGLEFFCLCCPDTGFLPSVRANLRGQEDSVSLDRNSNPVPLLSKIVSPPQTHSVFLYETFSAMTVHRVVTWMPIRQSPGPWVTRFLYLPFISRLLYWLNDFKEDPKASLPFVPLFLSMQC